MNKIEEALVAHWGERCPDHEPGCPCCDAWAEYDAMGADRIEQLVATNEALPAVAASQSVRVKPLVWKEDEYGNFRAQSIRGGEGVDLLTEPQVIGDEIVIYKIYEAWGIEGMFDDPVAAKSAAQADYEARILAALKGADRE